MPPLRIAITGSSGVGKTTLAGALASRLGVEMIPELARILVAEKGYERIGEIPDQEGFKREVLARQINAERSHESFVCDRCVIDTWILWQRWNICQAMTYDTESVYQTVREHSGSYSHIVYVPPLFEPQQDGFRWTEPDYIKQVDRITRMTLYELGVLERTFTVTSGDADTRLNEVLAWLGKSGEAD